MRRRPRSDGEETFTLESARAPASRFAAGTRVAGRYEILSLLGEGAMGVVYRARDLELNEVVALKVLRRGAVDAPGALERFRREVKLARRVTHRNVARTFDIGDDGGEKYLTMELVDGEPLSVRIARGPLPVAEIVSIAADVCEALAAAHAAGVVHRDLKPENVLIAADGRVVVTDFGIACRDFAGAAEVGKATLGTLLGTPAYMAPEQVEGRADIDARADLYALGASLHEMATGALPWGGSSPIAVAAARLTQPPPDTRSSRPDLPPALADLILCCLARDKEARPASASALGAALRVLQAEALSSPVTPAAPTLVDPPTSRPRADTTLAVLPFRNAGPADDDYLADGLADDLVDTLCMTRGLRVRSRGPAGDGGPRDAAESGRRLGVQVVVDGSLRRQGEVVRVSARLVSVADGFQIWAQRFERALSDLLVLSDEVAHAIAGALAAELVSPERQAPTDPEVIDLYLRARQALGRAWIADPAAAIDLFERALRRAPHDPTILAGYAIARVRQSFLGGRYGELTTQLAREAAQRAVAAGPGLGEPYVALASVRFNTGDAPGAIASLRRALANAPGLAIAHDLLGRILLEVGPVDEAKARLERAIWSDPMLSGACADLARAHAFDGAWPRVDDFMEALQEKSPLQHAVYTARFALWRRDASPPPVTAAESGPARIALVMRDTAATRALAPEHRRFLETIIDDAAPGSRARRAFLQVRAEMLEVAGDPAAIDSVAGAVDEGLLDLTWMDRCPVLTTARADARFAGLRARVAERAREVLDAWRSPSG
jgi:serine/threonine-protein kinase